MHDAAKADTMFYELEFRRSNPEWKSLKETLDPGYKALQDIASSIEAEYDKFKINSELALEALQENTEGQTEFHYGIFPISIRNPGFIENGKLSWEEE